MVLRAEDRRQQKTTGRCGVEDKTADGRPHERPRGRAAGVSEGIIKAIPGWDGFI